MILIVIILRLQNGTLKIIDRKRHIFKLSQGEYIVPEKIETIYLKSQYVHQVFVHGESIKVNNNTIFIFTISSLFRILKLDMNKMNQVYNI